MNGEEWQVGSSRGTEQLTRKHSHHTSSGVYLGHVDSVLCVQARMQFAFLNEGWYIRRWLVVQSLESQ